MTLTLKTEWIARLKLCAEGDKLCAEGSKLRAEGDKLCAEGDKLYNKGSKLRAEGGKLCSEGDKLCAEGDKLYAEGSELCAEGDIYFMSAVIAKFGNIRIKWDYNKNVILTLENGEVYSEDMEYENV